MKDAVCEAYMNLLTDLTVIAPPTECGYPGVWPNLSHVESAVSHLGSEFYSRLVSSDCTLFCDGGHWKNFKDTMILSPELESHSTSFSATTLRVARLCLKGKPEHLSIYLPEFCEESTTEFRPWGLPHKTHLLYRTLLQRALPTTYTSSGWY